MDNFIAKYNGKTVLYNQRDKSLAGQCVQLVCFYVQEVAGKPIIWANAADWWYSNQYPEHYERIPNTPNAAPLRGDIVIWDRNLAGSGGAGHIAICVTPKPGTGTFVSFDSNWGGRYAHLVTHNYNNVVGWLRPKIPAPQPKGDNDEMITNSDQATKLYKMLRPNGGASDAEVQGTAGRRTFVNFLNDAQGEISARDSNLRQQAQKLSDMTVTINRQNETLTTLQQKLADSEATGKEKQKALTEALEKLSKANADITSTHDELKDLQDTNVIASKPFTPDSSWFIKLLARFVKK